MEGGWDFGEEGTSVLGVVRQLSWFPRQQRRQQQQQRRQQLPNVLLSPLAISGDWISSLF